MIATFYFFKKFTFARATITNIKNNYSIPEENR